MNALLDAARRRARRVVGRARRRLSGGDDGGFVLLESIIAISLITVIMAAIGVEYVSGLASVARQRATQTAAQLADSTLEQARALRPSDLVTGRGATSVQTQFTQGNAITQIAPWLQNMDQASDASVPAAAGAAATIPTCDPTPQGAAGPALCTQKPGAVAFTIAQFLGTCWLVSSGNSSNCVPSAQKTAASVQYLRVVVSVAWKSGTCTAGCYYVTSTLINADADPTFKANQPPPAAPAINDPPDQNNDIGDAVSLQLALVAGTGVPAYRWAVTAGSLPTGLTMSASGLISGTVGGSAGARSVTVQVTDGYGRTDTTTFNWKTAAAPTIAAPGNQTTQINTPVNLQLTTTCANTPCVYKLNNAPAGLTVSSTGLITGTPTVSGTNTVTVTVTDAATVSVTTAAFTWTVLSNAPTCPTAVALANGSFETPGVSAGAGANVGNGTSGLAWATNDANGQVEYWANGGNSQINNGNTPITAQSGAQWVEVNGAGMDTLYQDLSTTPGQVLQWSLWHRARNATNNVNAQDSIQVQMGSTTQQSPQVPNGAVNPTISDDASAWVQYTGVYTVPAGQTTTRFQVAATGTSSGSAGAGNFLDNVAVTGAPCLTSAPADQTSTVGAAIAPVQLTASQGSGSYTWSGASTLPAGLSLSSSGLITGTPTAVGTTSVSLLVTDATSSYQQAVTFTWTVKAAPTVSTPSNQTTSVGAAVNITVGSSCPNTPCAYTLNNAPAGLSMTGAAITGSPTATGTFTSTVTVRDAAGASATTGAFTWTVYAAPTLTNPGTQNTTVGAAVNLTLGSTCAYQPCAYSVSGLPAGLSMSGATISGTPTATGSTNVTATIRDAAGSTATTSFTWGVYPAPTITTPANQTTSVGAAVNITVGSSCPNTPCTYTLNNAPAGLSMTGAAITGSPTATGTFTSTVTVRDAAGTTATTGSFTWTVYAAPTVTTPANQTTSVGSTVNLTVGSTCPNSPCAYTLNNAPGGLSISNSGVIAGSPTTAATTVSTVTIRDASGSSATTANFTWTVKAAPSITTPGNQNTTVGATVTLTPASTCGNTPCVYSVTNPPAGLSYNTGTGAFTGSPTTPGSYAVTISIRDASGATATASFTWTVYAAPTITTPANQKTSVGATVNLTVGSTCPNTPCTYTASALPAGLRMSGAAVVGTPTATGTTTTTVTVRDASGSTATTGSFTWTVLAAPTVTKPANQITSVGATVNLTVGSSCPNTPCTYTLNSPPPGLGMTGAAITGTPTTAGTYTSTVTVRDNAGVSATTSSFTYTVKAAPTITSPGNRKTTVGSAVSLQLTTTCANTPCTYALSGQPAGLTISNAGLISGTPTTTGISSAVTASVTDAAGSTATTAAFSWTIYAAPTITTPANQTSTVNTALILPITSSCPNTACSYALTGAPTGLTINTTTGQISGTPTATGVSSSVKVTVTDASGVAASTAAFTWTITAKPSVTSPGNLNTVNNSTVDQPFTTSCPNSPCAYALNNGPAGLSITTAGHITGRVTSAPQTFPNVTITVTDNSGATATSAAFAWYVYAPLAGRWTFDEASGSSAADSAGSHNATLTGGYGKTTAAAQGANALTLNGSSGTAATTSAAVLNTASSFSVSAWVKLASTSGYQTFVSQDGANASAFYLQLRGDTGKFAFTRLGSDTTNSPATTTAGASATPVTGQWYQLTGVYDASSGTISLFVNGVRQGAPVAYSGGWNGTGNFAIGRGNYGGATDWTNGAIDDVRAYQLALSDGAVAQLAQAVYWPLDEGSGTTANDNSLNNVNGTLSGGATWTSGIVGPSAAQFDATSGAITAGSSAIDTSQSFSVAAWAKADSATASGSGSYAVASVDGASVSSFALVASGGRWVLARPASDSTSASITSVVSTSAITAGQWYHLAAVYDSVAKTLTLYVNGVQQGSPVAYTTGWKASGAFVAGRGKAGASTYWFGGAVDDLQAFQFPLDQSGVSALAKLTPPSPGSPTATAGAASAAVSWNAPTAVAGSPITGYVVTPYLDGVAQSPITYNSTATSQTLTGLTSGGSYTFTVAALNSNGASAPSGQSAAVLPS